MLLAGLLFCLGSLLIALSALIYWRDRALSAEAHRVVYRQELIAEQARRVDYERALGLPLQDRELCERDLWARAAEGDEFVRELLALRLERDLEGGLPVRVPTVTGRMI